MHALFFFLNEEIKRSIRQIIEEQEKICFGSDLNPRSPLFSIIFLKEKFISEYQVSIINKLK